MQNKQETPFNKKRSLYRILMDFFLKSAIIQAIYGFTSAFYRKISSSLIAAFFSSYGKMASLLSDSVIVNALKPKTALLPSQTLSFRIAAKYETSIFALAVEKIKWSLLTCQLNILAVFGITFGFTSAFALILQNFAFKIQKISFDELMKLASPLMASLCFIIVSLLLIFSKKPLIQVVNESTFLSRIFFDLLKIRKVPYYDYENISGLNAGIATLLGTALGALSLLVPPSKIILAMGVAVVFLIIMHSPEAGTASVFFLLPFISTMSLVYLVCSIAFSYLIKFFRRKRSFKMETIDFAVLIFALFIISGGFISVDIVSSVPKMAVFFCFMSMYFIIKNIIRSETLISSCALCLSYSSIIVSSIGLARYFIGDISQKWQDTDMFGSIPGRAVSTFENPNVLGEYLILILPLLFAMLLSSKNVGDKLLFFSAFSLCSCCLIFTWSRGAWLGFAFAVILFILLKSHQFLAAIITFSPALLLAVSFILNQNIIDRIMSIGNTSDSSTLYRLNIWIGSLDMLDDTALYGIGIGTEAFSSIFPRYALSGTEVAPHTHSLYLQIVSEMGIFALIAFIAVIFCLASMTFACIQESTRKNSRTMPIGCLCGIAAFLIQGLTDYVWYNYRIFLFFWMILGFSVAVIKVCAESERRRFLYV